MNLEQLAYQDELDEAAEKRAELLRLKQRPSYLHASPPRGRWAKDFDGICRWVTEDPIHKPPKGQWQKVDGRFLFVLDPKPAITQDEQGHFVLPL